jgi:hypothetical protein
MKCSFTTLALKGYSPPVRNPQQHKHVQQQNRLEATIFQSRDFQIMLAS